MAIKSSVVSVTTAAGGTLLFSPTFGSVTAPRGVLVRNAHATEAVFLGGSGVTAAAGLTLAAGASLPLALVAGDDLYAICVTGPCSVEVLRTGN